MKKLVFCLGLFVLATPTEGIAAHIMFEVSLDSSVLIGHAAGPFSLNFQFNDGSGFGDANNRASLTHIQFGTGAALGLPSVTGGANGDVSSEVVITDTAFLNSFTQPFIAGSFLSFRVLLSTNPDVGPTPDQFSFALLDSSGLELPTQGFGAAGSDALLLIDIDPAMPVVRTFAADITRSPLAGGPPIDFAAPSASVVVPEPGTVWAVLMGLAIALGRRCSNRRTTMHSTASPEGPNLLLPVTCSHGLGSGVACVNKLGLRTRHRGGGAKRADASIRSARLTR